jgi:hypothetical protein
VGTWRTRRQGQEKEARREEAQTDAATEGATVTNTARRLSHLAHAWFRYAFACDPVAAMREARAFCRANGWRFMRGRWSPPEG